MFEQSPSTLRVSADHGQALMRITDADGREVARLTMSPRDADLLAEHITCVVTEIMAGGRDPPTPHPATYRKTPCT